MARTAAKWSLSAIGAILAVVFVTALLLESHPPREWLADRASGSIGRDVAIERLDLHLISLRPALKAGGLRVANPPWAGEGAAVRIRELTVNIDLLELLKGRLILPLVAIRAPEFTLIREPGGRVNWMERSALGTSSTHRLPVIHELVIERGRITLIDSLRDVRLYADVEAGERSVGDRRRFGFESVGQLDGQKFEFELESEPIVHMEPGHPWRFEARVATEDTRLFANGRILEAFDLSRFEVDLDLSGSDLATTYHLTGLPMPATPPYAVTASVTRDGEQYRIQNIEGTVGDSDVTGSAAIDVSGARPYLTAELHSDNLDLDDLAAALGAPPQTGAGETASPQQKAVARRMEQRDELLPRARLDVDRLRQLDAAVSFEADAFRTARLPIRSLRFDLDLEQGQLVLNPLSVELENGRVAGNASLDATRDPPDTAVNIVLSGVSLAPLLRTAPDTPPTEEAALEGILEGRVRLSGSGYSVHENASVASGDITLVVPSGRVRKALAALTAIDVLEALGLFLSGDDQQTSLRCAVAHFDAEDGTLDLETMVADTEDIVITGQGRIALGPERIDLEIQGRPKEPRLMRVRSDITVDGPLRDPQLGIEESDLLKQGAVSAALATLVGPLAALLPFVDPGLVDDQNCAALIGELRG